MAEKKESIGGALSRAVLKKPSSFEPENITLNSTLDDGEVDSGTVTKGDLFLRLEKKVRLNSLYSKKVCIKASMHKKLMKLSSETKFSIQALVDFFLNYAVGDIRKKGRGLLEFRRPVEKVESPNSSDISEN